MTDGVAVEAPAAAATAAERSREVEPSPRTPRRRRTSRLRLTPFGLCVAIGVAVVLANAAGAVDPQIVAAVVIVALGLCALGLVWPVLTVRRVSVRARAPRDVTVGEAVPVSIEIGGCPGGCQVRPLDPAGDWHRAAEGATAEIAHRAERRGTFSEIRFEVRVTAPLGLVAAHRIVVVGLPVPVDVAPRPLPVTWDPERAPQGSTTSTAPVPVRSGEVVRSVRPYSPGDPSHLVHWPSTARAAALVVREMEPPTRIRVALVVDLRGTGSGTERTASFAHGLGRVVLDAGGELLLATFDGQAGTPLCASVGSRVALGRRLARAAAGPPGAVPADWPAIDVGDWWWRQEGWQAPLVRPAPGEPG